MIDRIDATAWRLRNVTRMARARHDMRDANVTALMLLIVFLFLLVAENVR